MAKFIAIITTCSEREIAFLMITHIGCMGMVTGVVVCGSVVVVGAAVVVVVGWVVLRMVCGYYYKIRQHVRKNRREHFHEVDLVL